MTNVKRFNDIVNESLITEQSELQKEYQTFFKALLSKYGVKSPNQLNDSKKKEFFNEISDHYIKGQGLKKSGQEIVEEYGN